MSTLSARALALLLSDWREQATAAYQALADRIRLLVLDGRLPVGARLPAERELAARLGISRTTVTAAYAELRDAGYLSSVRGSGSVTRLPGPGPISIDPNVDGYLDFTKAAMPAVPGIVDAAARAIEELPGYLGDTGFDPLGIPVLREAIARRYTARGLPTEPNQIMVTIGAQHAIALLARTLIGRGDSAIVEAPTYPHAYEALRVAGARLVPVSVTTEHGWDEAALEQAIQRSSPALAYLMPDFHNPTGRSMSPEMRERVAQLAARHGTRIIADETMAELAIDEAPSALPFAVTGDAITIGSVGKTVWGGIRVGWIRAEPALIQKLARNRLSGDLGTPIIEQLIVTQLLADYDSILELRRLQLRDGRDHLVSALREALPEWSVPRAAGGLTTWVNLGAPVSSQLTLAARNEGLLITAGPRFGIDGAFERFMRVPHSYPRDETDRAVAMLARAWGSLARAPQEQADYFAVVV
ncbi:GntR family transcriptional regulator [Homoserinimonas aerilata]|uniref:GntR family transcriptional regulator n=1 Tax=Homoserinimonas aerilata TaxID=1162970 RepID=A0A542XX62_9MICO|nr:PLP-dependent aminotransferase family protein [Homoserinimonas aerilata]TQL40431.1 GntR family transcriptional regulator [Homoserinimonas aerilata]